MISEKIKEQILSLDDSDDFKHLLLCILEEEDTGLYQYKESYEKLINSYIDIKKGRHS